MRRVVLEGDGAETILDLLWLAAFPQTVKDLALAGAAEVTFNLVPCDLFLDPPIPRHLLLAGHGILRISIRGLPSYWQQFSFLNYISMTAVN